MNAARLLEHFEQISDAADAVPRLRRFVLDLAATGRLLPGPNPSWSTTPITECLEPLADGRLIHQGWSPQCKDHPSADDCIWAVLKTTAVQDGCFFQEHQKELPSHLDPKPLLEVQPQDLLITCAGPRARCGIPCLVEAVRPRLMISGKMYRFRAKKDVLIPRFLLLLLRSAGAQAAIDAMKTGSSESGLNLTKERFSKLAISFGSLADQQRIVAKVDELMALCDRLEAAQVDREARRDRLVAASLARVSQPTAADAASDARAAGFHLDHFARLTTRPEHVKHLRQTILNLAVRGRLVPQDPVDGTGMKLLNELHAEKKQAHRRDRDESSFPYAIPKSWSRARLGDIVVFGPQNGVSPKPTDVQSAPKAITLTATTSGRFDHRFFKHVDIRVPADSEYWLREGDMLFQRGNTREYVGIAAVYAGPPNTFLYPDLMIKVRLSSLVDLQFMHLSVTAPPARAYFGENAAGAQQSMPKINQSVLLALPIPLPPLAEQRRIVAKVDELMALCDQLEASLAAAATDRARLLESLLHEALAPAA